MKLLHHSLRKIIFILLTIIPFTVSIFASSSQPETTHLKSWKYKAVSDSSWSKCSVPGIIQDYLIQDNRLPLPYYQTNETKIQEVSEQDWLYSTTFKIESIAPDRQYQLCFDGIDTYSDIFLNGVHLGSTKNMFLKYCFDISKYLREGDNILTVKIISPIQKAYPQYLSNGFNYPADNDHADEHLSVFTRKSPYHYGWDWGMRMLSMGIWKNVYINCYENKYIKDVEVQQEITWKEKGIPEDARLQIGIDLSAYHQDSNYFIEAKIFGKNREILDQTRKEIDGQSTHTELDLKVKSPQLWWPNGLGMPNLHTLELALIAPNRMDTVYRKEIRIGIREIKFINRKDQWGKSFYFLVNGYPIFAKGANYIPGEMILTKRGDKYFQKLFKDIKFANFNFLRVWGGGIYEDDLFYELADENGILVWQDFMFSCTPYPSDSSFLANVKDEATYQVRRLRNHACIALWCGNNEIEEGTKYWGWQKRFSKEVYKRMQESYSPLFHELLPSIVERENPQNSYIHGSPMETNWGNRDSLMYGDAHYWGLWYGRDDFEVFEDLPSRFVSEFGFQCFPEMKTIRAFAEESDMDLESEVMRNHQKASTGNKLIKEYMSKEYFVPNKFDDFVYVSQVLQGRGMAHSVKALRSQRDKCMGALYWQLNDVWPAISWSSIDYFGNYKAMHYRIRDAFAPISLAIRKGGDGQLLVYVLNDSMNPLNSVYMELIYTDLYGNRLDKKRIPLNRIEKNSVSSVIPISLLEWQHKIAKEKALIQVRVCEDKSNKVLAEELYFSVKDKDLHLPSAHIETKVLKVEGKTITLQIQSDAFVKDLFIETMENACEYSDNYFDLLPGQKKLVLIKYPNKEAANKHRFFIHSMNQIHKKYGVQKTD